jgi:transglutaminase-like putative cysteine protease
MEILPAPDDINRRECLWDWRAAFLTVALVAISSRRLAVTEWVPFLYFTQTVSVVGSILGLALGCSKFSRQTALRLAAGYTFVLIPAQLLSAIDGTGWLWQDVAALSNRLFISLDQFIQGRPVYDPLFFVSIVTLVYWMIGLSAGYWLTRHRNFLSVVLPSSVAILTVQAFDFAGDRHVWQLALFIFVSLLLLGRMYFLQNQSFWKKTHFLLTEDAVNDIGRGALAVTAIVVFIAWSLPGWINGIRPAARAWHNFSQPVLDKFSNAVSALNSPYVKNAGGDFYGDALALGQKAAVGDTPVFIVDVKNSNFTPVRSYWKGRVYDQYLDGKWTTSASSSGFFLPAVNELIVEYPDARHEMEYTFTSRVKKQNLLYAPEETIWVSMRADIISTPISADVKDVTAWVAAQSFSSGNQYRVRALIADPSIKELRTAGTEYPAWVTNRYLQIPENIVLPLRKLALQITAPYDTAYDKAQAITSYLRKEIQYETTMTAALPENQDPVLWVLFDYKKGFCMYYASAEILMLRSIGIPARMAVGFVEGAYDELKREYVVTYQDSHAWPEVFFPNIGWVEFEPTSSQFPIERPETKNRFSDEAAPTLTAAENLSASQMTATAPQNQPALEADSASALARTKLYGSILITVLVLLTLGLGIFFIRRGSLHDRLPVYLENQYKRRGNASPQWLRRWIVWTNLSAIERAFQAVNLSLFWLGLSQPAYITSRQRAEVLINRLPSAQDQTLLLLKEYQTVTCTPRTGNIASARKAAIIILLKTWQVRFFKVVKKDV